MHRIVHEALLAITHKNVEGHLVLNVKELKFKPDFLWDEIFVEILHRVDMEPSEKKVIALHRLCSQPTGRTVKLNSRIEACRDRII